MKEYVDGGEGQEHLEVEMSMRQSRITLTTE